nr:S24 family peptidase [uncultured Pedobacter sp.]
MVLTTNRVEFGVISSNSKMEIVPEGFTKAFPNSQIHSIFEVWNNDAEHFGIKRGSIVCVNQSIKPKGGMLLIVKQKERWMIRQLLTYGDISLISTGKENAKPIHINEVEVYGVITWCCSAKIDYSL